MLKRWLASLAAGAALLFALAAAAEVPVPPLKARVTDLTGTLSASQIQSLESRLRDFERAKGSQIAVLMLPSTQPETPVEYGVRVYDQWKLGRKGINDGALLLVAKADRRVWIVTGRGVEGALPDAAVRRIVEEEITPHFRQGDFYGGIRSGIDRMIRTLEGEPLPPPTRAAQQAPLFEHIEWLVPAFFVLLIAANIMNAIFGRALGAGLTGGGAGLLAWLLVGSLAVGVFVGVIALIFGLFTSFFRHGSGWGGGWNSGGGFGGGGFGGGDFGGGGFSGGGGDTAGGGAGGSW